MYLVSNGSGRAVYAVQNRQVGKGFNGVHELNPSQQEFFNDIIVVGFHTIFRGAFTFGDLLHADEMDVVLVLVEDRDRDVVRHV